MAGKEGEEDALVFMCHLSCSPIYGVGSLPSPSDQDSFYKCSKTVIAIRFLSAAEKTFAQITSEGELTIFSVEIQTDFDGRV